MTNNENKCDGGGRPPFCSTRSQEENKVNSDSSGSRDSKIRLALYDIEVMVENLKVKSTEHGQGDIIQRIYDIHSLLSE